MRTHHYDRERGNAHYIKGVESAMEYIKSISGFGFSFWVDEDDFMVTVKNEIPKPRIIAVCGSEISNKTRILRDKSNKKDVII